MANIYKEFGTDHESERDGVWLEYGDTEEGAYAIKIARAGGMNKKFQKVMEKKSRPHRRKFETRTATPGLADKITIEAFAETVVIDWRNITGPDGENIPFSKKGCVKLFTDLPDLFEMIRDEAQAIVNFQKSEVEEDEKN